MKRLYTYGLAACALLAVGTAAMHGVAVAETAAVAVAPAAAPAAAAPLVVAEVSWWQTLWAQIQAPLMALVLAVLAALGTVVTATANKYLGSRASQAVNAVYQLAVDQAAGWLHAHIAASAQPVIRTSAGPGPSAAVPTGTLSVSSHAAQAALESAVLYAKKSYPEVIDKLKVPDSDIAKDVLAAAGKMIAGRAAPPGIAEAIGSLMGAIVKH